MEQPADLREPLLRASSRNLGEKPVLDQLFHPHSKRCLRTHIVVKSDLYTLLNPRSRQRSAKYFKGFISLVILVDFVAFVISTEPAYREDGKCKRIFEIIEGATSTIFLIEFLARFLTITESKKYKHYGPVIGRIYFMVQLPSIVDLLATAPFFLEWGTGLQLPQLTYLRTFRLVRILKTSGFVKAMDAVWRVLYYNRQIMYMSIFVGLFMILTTSVLMFYLRPRLELQSDHFESMLSTMYLSTLLLTGSSSVGDLPELPWYTKGVVLLTSAFSIGMFAIPVSMLTWGFEAEAARCAKRQRQLAKRRLNSQSVDSGDLSSDYSTDEEYQRIIADEGSDSEEDIVKKAILEFQSADTDGSNSMSLNEFLALSKKNQTPKLSNVFSASEKEITERLCTLEKKVDAMAAKIDRLCKSLS